MNPLYRAWDKNGNAFVDLNTYHLKLYDDGSGLLGDFTGERKYEIDIDDVCLEWYTNLDDRGRHKIFEGDIIDVIYDDRTLSPRNVFFEDGCFGVLNVTNKFIPLIQIVDRSVIIGNIHEDPDLVEKCQGKSCGEYRE